MGGFSAAQATGAKRRATAAIAATARPTKVPRASDVAVAQPIAKTSPSYRALPMSAPVNVCLYKATGCAGDVWDAVSSDVPLYQVQIEHGAQRPVTFHIRGKPYITCCAPIVEHVSRPRSGHVPNFA